MKQDKMAKLGVTASIMAISAAGITAAAMAKNQGPKKLKKKISKAVKSAEDMVNSVSSFF